MVEEINGYKWITIVDPKKGCKVGEELPEGTVLSDTDIVEYFADLFSIPVGDILVRNSNSTPGFKDIYSKNLE